MSEVNVMANCNIKLLHTTSPGAFRGMVCGGAIAPTLSAQPAAVLGGALYLVTYIFLATRKNLEKSKKISRVSCAARPWLCQGK